MKVALLTNEFPPDIYGGAGIHVQFLSRELRNHCEIEARAFGSQNDSEKNLNAITQVEFPARQSEIVQNSESVGHQSAMDEQPPRN